MGRPKVNMASLPSINLMDVLSKKNPNAEIDVEDITTLVEQTDKLSDEEEKSMIDGKEINNEAKATTLAEQWQEQYALEMVQKQL